VILRRFPGSSFHDLSVSKAVSSILGTTKTQGPKAAAIRIAVASDLHAYANDGSSPSHLDIRAAENLPNQHPLAGLLKLIRDEGLTADAILSPGDLGHQASIEGIKYAWDALHQLKNIAAILYYSRRKSQVPWVPEPVR
jgi:hypothetical protein